MGYFETFGDDYVESMNNAVDEAVVKSKRTDGTTYDPIPDGKYQAFVSSMETRDPASWSNFPNFLMTFVITDGDFKNRKLFKSYLLEPNADYISNLKTDLSVIGIELRKITDLEDESVMSEGLDKLVELRVQNRVSKTNGRSYSNVYINKCVGTLIGGVADDEPPF